MTLPPTAPRSFAHPAGVSAVGAAVSRAAPAGPDTAPGTGGVLHVVGRLTEAVFHLLGPLSEALDEQGCPQTLLLLDDPTGRRLAARLPAAVECRWVAGSGWLRLGRQLGQLTQARAYGAVHLHGVVPLCLGAPLSRRLDAAGTRVVVSPHNSRSLQQWRWLGRPLLTALRWVWPVHHYRTIANLAHDVRALRRVARMPAQLIESPVAEVFFAVAHQVDAAEPQIVGTAAADAAQAAQRFAQLAVLLGDAEPRPRFTWAGELPDDEDRARLQAAGVRLLERPEDPYHRAQALAHATLCVVPDGGRGFPMALAEAMTVGLPCVAWNLPAHADLIEPGTTGLLAGSVTRMQAVVGQLLASPQLRRPMGEAARHAALQRFSAQAFRQRLAGAYRVGDGAEGPGSAR